MAVDSDKIEEITGYDRQMFGPQKELKKDGKKNFPSYLVLGSDNNRENNVFFSVNGGQSIFSFQNMVLNLNHFAVPQHN